VADILSPKERSERMSRVKGKDTKPEIVFRKALWREGLRYRLRSKVFGRPDIVFPGPKVAVFVDGCFWHGCPEHYRAPKTRTDWWENKISGNKKRDIEVTRYLEDNGWKVLRFWTHDLKRKHLSESVQKTAETVVSINTSNRSVDL